MDVIFVVVIDFNMVGTKQNESNMGKMDNTLTKLKDNQFRVQFPGHTTMGVRDNVLFYKTLEQFFLLLFLSSFYTSKNTVSNFIIKTNYLYHISLFSGKIKEKPGGKGK